MPSSQPFPLQSLCVYCGSSLGCREAYRRAAERVGEELVRRGIRLVYGGGNVGLMGVVADAVLGGGGEVVGVIPQALVEREVAHAGPMDLRVVHSMHERKALMEELSDAFLALPGGFGTLDELFEITTWMQLGLHRKAVGLLNVEGYFDPLLAFVDRAVDEGFVHPEHRAILMTGDDVSTLMDRLASEPLPALKRWIHAGET